MARSHSILGLAFALLLGPATAGAIAGIEGTLEFSLDAPWRIEPSVDEAGDAEYGAIPIQITVHDANFAKLDRALRTRTVVEHHNDGSTTRRSVPIKLPGPQRLGDFCSLSITDHTSGGRTRYAFADLAEVERSRGAWRNEENAEAPREHEVCRIDQGESCAHMVELTGTSEWYALAWYPVPSLFPGTERLDLELEMEVSRGRGGACVSGDPTHTIVFRNEVSVALGRSPLPRFGPGWLYGDLHYHSQGTDNEGESGHNYRGVVRAMGALGLDFAFATEHASSSDQLVDADIEISIEGFTAEIETSETRIALRDMSDARFRTLLGLLHGEGGVNREAAHRARNGSRPQTLRSAGHVPQVFLGGEVDVIPEAESGAASYGYGNGLRFSVLNLCGGWKSILSGDCPTMDLLDPQLDAVLMRDVQGLNRLDYARWHMVYLPRRSSDAGAFVASHTGPYGGGRRRLSEPFLGRGAIAPEIAQHGYAFIAHPLSGAGEGNNGPDSTPWTEHALRKAFAEPAILGLQLWNEDSHVKSVLSEADSSGYERPDTPVAGLAGQVPTEGVRQGFYSGVFALAGPRSHTGRRDFVRDAQLRSIAHGAYTWDQMNLWGLDPGETSRLAWLERGEPRRVLMAGGSDAHGDLNYRREGYFLGDTKLSDTAIGKPRNLVYAGILRPSVTGTDISTGTLAPDYGSPGSDDDTSFSSPYLSYLTGSQSSSSASYTSVSTSQDLSTQTYDDEWSTSGGDEAAVHSQEQIVDALASGHFSITDGPALRLVVDRNRNGEIDGEDTPMGGVVDLYGESVLPILVEWKSTDDFNGIDGFELVVGVEGGGRTRLYAPRGQGPRAEDLPGYVTLESYVDFHTYERGEDGYWRVDSQSLREEFYNVTGSMEGVAAVDLDLGALTAGPGTPGERYFVRAFVYAATRVGLANRYAFTNPVWAIQREFASCPTDAARAIDADVDGIPDGCDPCVSGGPDAPYDTCAWNNDITIGVYGGASEDDGSSSFGWSTSGGSPGFSFGR